MSEIKKTDPFLSVVQANKGIIYKVANSYCRNIEDRKDLIQEIVMQLLKSFDDYDSRYKHTTWIYRISLNVAISFYRKEHRRQKISIPFTEGIIHFADNEIHEDKESDLGILQQMILQLKDLDKALMLLYLEENSHKEISQIMGISVSNVATKLNRIKNVLKEKFTQIKNH